MKKILLVILTAFIGIAMIGCSNSKNIETLRESFVEQEWGLSIFNADTYNKCTTNMGCVTYNLETTVITYELVQDTKFTATINLHTGDYYAEETNIETEEVIISMDGDFFEHDSCFDDETYDQDICFPNILLYPYSQVVYVAAMVGLSIKDIS